MLGTTDASANYTYITDPQILGISPSSGSTLGGQSVKITGTNLSGATVTIGDISANITSISSTEIQCTTPAGSLGIATVRVKVLGTTDASANYTYINDPKILDIQPRSGSTAGGQTVTITGTNLSNATVTIGGTTITPFIVSNNEIRFTTPPRSGGSTSVTVSVPGTSSATEVYTYTEIVIATNTEIVISNICFIAGTPITTDQGNIPIELINPDIHTIHNNKIVAITKTITQDTYLVCFEKHSLGLNKPNKKTITSKHHKVYYNGVMTKAHHFLKQFKHVSEIEYNGEILYNVLMEKYDKLKVNNLTFETLDPKNIIAKLYTSGFDEEYKNKIIVMINHSITQTDTCLYQNIINRIVNDKNISTCFDEQEYKEQEYKEQEYEEQEYEKQEYNISDEDGTKHFEITQTYANKPYHIPSVNFKIKINLENITLNSKLNKYIKTCQTKEDNTDELVKKKEFLNKKKEEKEDMEIERKKERKRDKTQKLKIRQHHMLSVSQKNYKSLFKLC